MSEDMDAATAHERRRRESLMLLGLSALWLATTVSLAQVPEYRDILLIFLLGAGGGLIPATQRLKQSRSAA